MNDNTPITGILEIFNSRRDSNGNCYWAFTYTDVATGKTVSANISGGESNISGIRRHLNPEVEGWDRSIKYSTTELPIREFNRLKKDWPYAGCASEDIAEFIREQLVA
jgi:hypothetical protein